MRKALTEKKDGGADFLNLERTGKLPEEFEAAKIDLNRSGRAAYILSSPNGYSGGGCYVIYERRKSKYLAVAQMQGHFYFGSRINGYYQICGASRLGGGEYRYYVQRYLKGLYYEYKAVVLDTRGH